MRIQLFSKVILAAAVGSTLGIGLSPAQEPQQQPAQTQQASPWKDIAEYDLYQQITKATDPKERLRLLDQWKQKYPDSKLKTDRLQLIMGTHQQLQDPQGMAATAQEILAGDPQEPRALWALTLLANATQDAARLEAGEKAAKTIVENGDAVFAAAKKPAGTDDAAWTKFRTETENLAYRTLGWIYTARKNFPEADKYLHEYLKRYSTDGEAAYWLGSAIIGQKQPERQSEALFYVARAAAYDGPGAYPPERRKQVEAYLVKAYKSVHGDDSGLQELLALAKANAAPPADFKILSAAEIEAQKEAELAGKDPALALWMRLRGALQGSDGAQYFEGNMKDALVPPEGQPAFKGHVIKATPLRNPTTIVVGVADPKVADATITLVEGESMPGAAEPGTPIQFRGAAKSFTHEPFMVQFEAEKANITGWPAPAAKKAVKKAAPKKK